MSNETTKNSAMGFTLSRKTLTARRRGNSLHSNHSHLIKRGRPTENSGGMMAMQITRAWILTVSAILLCVLQSSWSFAATVEEVALMKSANREKLLIEGAKKEGKVVFLYRVDRRSSRSPGQGCFREGIPVCSSRVFSVATRKGWRKRCWLSIRRKDTTST